MANYLGKSYSDVVKGLLKSGYILEKKFDEICWLVCGKLLVFICAYVNLYHRDYDNDGDLNIFLTGVTNITKVYQNTLSPMALPLSSGYRLISLRGNIQTLTATVKDLPDGTYYWGGIQAIDTAFAGSY
jgi:hypothetical protein